MKLKNLTIVMSFLLLVCTINSCKKEELSPTHSANTKETIAIQEPQEMMTLSAIALRFNQGGRSNDMIKLLSLPDIATKYNWELVWYGYNHLKSAELMIVKHKINPNTYAIVNKGQDMENLFSLYQGINVITTEDWPYTSPYKPNLKVAGGGMSLIDVVLDLNASFAKGGYSTGNLWSVIDDIIKTKWNKSAPLKLYVTGHSLGGACSIGVSSYLHYKLSQVPNIPDNQIQLSVYDFAGPGLYSQEFVEYYNSLKKDTHIKTKQVFYHLYRDVVSNYFPDKMDEIYDNYYDWGLIMKGTIKTFLAGFDASMHLAGVTYKQVGTPYDNSNITLKNLADPKDYGIDVSKKINDPIDFAHYYKYNHFTSSYLKSLGAKEVPELKDL